jgi:hypothetical protein
MYQDGDAADLHHRFWPELRLFHEARSLTAGEDDNLHEFKYLSKLKRAERGSTGGKRFAPSPLFQRMLGPSNE